MSERLPGRGACWGTGAPRDEELGFEGVRRQRSGEQEALDKVDPLVLDLGHLGGSFDPFGQCGETEVLAELDQGGKEGLGLR